MKTQTFIIYSRPFYIFQFCIKFKVLFSFFNDPSYHLVEDDRFLEVVHLMHKKQSGPFYTYQLFKIL